MTGKAKWVRESDGWRLFGTAFTIFKETQREWDIVENGYYLASTNYVEKAKKLCERLALVQVIGRSL